MGLLGGVTAYHLRILADNPWSGGGGYTFEQIGEMTLDQIWARLCDINGLKKPIGERSSKIQTLNAPGTVGDQQGNVKGMANDGTPLKMKTTGKSKAAMLRDGTYEGYVIDEKTGKKKYVSTNKRRQRRKNKELEKENGTGTS